MHSLQDVFVNSRTADSHCWLTPRLNRSLVCSVSAPLWSLCDQPITRNRTNICPASLKPRWDNAAEDPNGSVDAASGPCGERRPEYLLLYCPAHSPPDACFVSAEPWEQRGLTFMAHWTTRVKPNQWTQAEIDVIVNISPILVFWYFAVVILAQARVLHVPVCKAFCQAAEPHNPSPPTPPQDPSCRAWSMLSYSHLSCLLGSSLMLHYPRRRGVSTERYFYYSPKGGYIELFLKANIVIMFSAPPSHQVVNAKKKLKKKRYINSGTVSRRSEMRAFMCLHGLRCRV